MKRMSRKLIVFFTIWLTLVITAVLTIFFADEAWKEYSGTFVMGLLVNGFVFICFKTLKDWIKAKHFNASLFSGKLELPQMASPEQLKEIGGGNESTDTENSELSQGH